MTTASQVDSVQNDLIEEPNTDGTERNTEDDTMEIKDDTIEIIASPTPYQKRHDLRHEEENDTDPRSVGFATDTLFLYLPW